VVNQNDTNSASFYNTVYCDTMHNAQAAKITNWKH